MSDGIVGAWLGPTKPMIKPSSFENKKRSTPYKLNLQAVCERAKSIPGCRQVYPNPAATAAAALALSSLPSMTSSMSTTTSLTLTTATTPMLPRTPPSPESAVRTRSKNNNSNNNNKTTTKSNSNDALVSFMVDLPMGPNKSTSGTINNSSNNTNNIHHHRNNSNHSVGGGAGGGGGGARDVARVNIFCDTGTIGVCRILNDGQVRQLFRRSVSSLDVVERLLRHPPEMTNIDANLVERFEPVLEDHPPPTNNNNNNTNNNNKRSMAPPPPPQPTTILQQDLELAEVGLYILQGERDKLINHLTALEEREVEERNNNNAGKKGLDHHSDDGSGSYNNHHHHHRGHHAPTPAHNMAVPLDVVAGMEFQFSLPVETMVQVEQCLQDISGLGKIVKHVSTNGKSTIFLYGHGGVAYTTHIPKPLHQRLKQLQRSAPEKRPCYVSLGSRERYYVGFYDGTADWRGPKALDKLLKERMLLHNNNNSNSNNNNNNNASGGASASSNSSETSQSTTMSTTTSKANFPQSVAFGTTYDTFFVVFGDGSWVCDGKGIPDALEDKLADRADRPDLVCVTLGPKGEWFLRAENGRMWWGGITSELDQLIQDLLEAGNYLSFIDFGEDGSYFVSYDDADETEEDDEEEDE